MSFFVAHLLLKTPNRHVDDLVFFTQATKKPASVLLKQIIQRHLN